MLPLKSKHGGDETIEEDATELKFPKGIFNINALVINNWDAGVKHLFNSVARGGGIGSKCPPLA